MHHVIGLGILMLWFQGFLVPYTLIGFIEILLIISILILLLNKILRMNPISTKEDKIP